MISTKISCSQVTVRLILSLVETYKNFVLTSYKVGLMWNVLLQLKKWEVNLIPKFSPVRVIFVSLWLTFSLVFKKKRRFIWSLYQVYLTHQVPMKKFHVCLINHCFIINTHKLTWLLRFILCRVTKFWFILVSLRIESCDKKRKIECNMSN